MKKNYFIASENGRSSRGKKISFSITVGLQEGYGTDGKLHTADEVVAAYHEWARDRALAGLPFVTGTATEGTVAYAYAWGEGAERQAGSGQEPNVAFGGELSHLYGADLVANPALAEGVVNGLAAALGNATGQTRIYVSLGDENWVLQREESATPTGD